VLPVAGVLLTAALVQDSAAADSVARPSVTVLPVISYSEMTGVQYGATGLVGFLVGGQSITRVSTISAYAALTTKGHSKVVVQLDRWSAGNSARWRARGEYISYPLQFFGIGSATPDSAEEWYSNGVTTGQAFMEQRMYRSTYVHVGARFIRSRSRETEPDGVLEQGTIPGSSGSKVVAPELGVVLDSRDNLVAPRSGSFTRVIPSFASTSLGSDFNYQRLTIDARHYRALGAVHSAAFQLQYDGMAGTAPFDLMPMIGADTAMRGYARGRYRDQHALTAQAEVRSGYWRRIGLVAFAGAGTVGPSLSGLPGGRWFPTGGVGGRLLLVPKDRTVARGDLGFGRGTFSFSIGIREAF
jgi:outer membrane protein assembly factor BamA